MLGMVVVGPTHLQESNTSGANSRAYSLITTRETGKFINAASKSIAPWDDVVSRFLPQQNSSQIPHQGLPLLALHAA